MEHALLPLLTEGTRLLIFASCAEGRVSPDVTSEGHFHQLGLGSCCWVCDIDRTNASPDEVSLFSPKFPPLGESLPGQTVTTAWAGQETCLLVHSLPVQPSHPDQLLVPHQQFTGTRPGALSKDLPPQASFSGACYRLVNTGNNATTNTPLSQYWQNSPCGNTYSGLSAIFCFSLYCLESDASYTGEKPASCRIRVSRWGVTVV